MLNASPRISQLDGPLYWKPCIFAIVTSKNIEQTAKAAPGSVRSLQDSRKSVCYPNVRFL